MSDETPREPTFGIGDNSDRLRTGDALTEYLEDAYAADLRRTEELLEKGAKYFLITNDEEDAAATEFLVSVRTRFKDSEASRVKEKAPFLDGGGRVDGFFNTQVLDVLSRGPSKPNEPFDPLEREDLGLGVRINRALTIYKTAKLKREQEARDAAAREAKRIEDEARAEAFRLQQEADAAAAAAARKRNADNRAAADAEAARLREQADAARATENKAAESRSTAATAAAAPAADITRSRGTRGGTTSLRTFITYRDVDREVMADQLRRLAEKANVKPEALTIYQLLSFIDPKHLEKAVEGYIDANKGAVQQHIKNKTQPLAGVIIYEDYKNAGRA